ncbi:hypothetical protein CAPTEDRAFT_218899 [Capitella teleta]|uniref:Gamma-secretase-activating protein C-terminal domain-containing protein n=1 Tax=Capitella teleta TaxID=283909 RepID=R7VCE6_CAPTE|nr:hypothetical protein CAPTEDRAFT_218899 [Capitella teleta]|eukprot:ELU16518.1 hypothetical protein CAPTEDRAFT_218899 [Capitella teleta]
MFSLSQVFSLPTEVCCCDLWVNKKLIGSYDVVNPYIIGREPGGKVLVAWNTLSSLMQLLLVHDKKLDVVSGTLNSEHSLLDVYKAFMAEVSPPNRVFYLNLEKELMMKLQFIHLLTSDPKQSHLLVLNGEPRKEKMPFAFVWSQYTYGRLYLLAFDKKKYDSNGVGVHRPIFLAFQLLPDATFEKKLEVTLDLPIPYSRRSSRCLYSNPGLTDTLADCSLNLRVLTHKNGKLCLCYQHNSRRTSETADKESGTGAKLDVKYFIMMVHHSKTITVAVKNVMIPHSTQILFTWFGSYLMAHLPGNFTHLLNVDLCLHRHVLTRADPSFQNMQCLPFHLGNDNNPSFIDVNTLTAFTMKLCQEPLVEEFRSQTLVHKLSLLQFVILQIKDDNLMKRLLGVVCENICDFDSVLLLQEYLVGGSFAQMIPKYNQSALRFFLSAMPLKESESLENVYLSSLKDVKYHDTAFPCYFWQSLQHRLLAAHKAERHAAFLCHDFQLSLVDKKGAVEELQPEKKSLMSKLGDMSKSAFTGLRRSAVPTQLYTSLPRDHKISEPLETLLSEEDDDSSGGSVGGALSMPPHYSGPTSAEKDQRQLVKMAQVSEAVTQHLVECLPTEEYNGLHKMACVYVNCQLRQSRELLKCLWNATGEGNDEKFYLILERYYSAIEQLNFPLPYNFNEYFTKHAFLALEFSVFLSYCDHNIFCLSQDFVNGLIREFGTEPEYADRIMQLLTRLSIEAAVSCLKKWQHPHSRTYLAKHFASLHLSDYGFHPTEDLFTRDPKICYKLMSEGDEQTSQAPSMRHLMEFIQKKKQDRLRGPTRQHRALSETAVRRH